MESSPISARILQQSVLSLALAVTSAAQVVNGGFEEDYYPANPITGWSGTGAVAGQPNGSPINPSTGFPFATVISSAGNCSGGMVNGTFLQQNLGTDPDREYVAHFAAKAMFGLPGLGRLKVAVIHVDGTVLAELEPALNSGGGGSEGFRSFSLPFRSTAGGGRVHLIFTNAEPVSSMVVIDDVRLESPVPSLTPALGLPFAKPDGTWFVAWTEPSLGYRLEYSEGLSGPWKPAPQPHTGAYPDPTLKREDDRLTFQIAAPRGTDLPALLYRLAPVPAGVRSE